MATATTKPNRGGGVKRKCPHGKRSTIVGLQVIKLGAWDLSNPYGLFVDVFGGGNIQLAEGTKRRMLELLRDAEKRLRGDWVLAETTATLIRGLIPPVDRPPR